MSEQLLYEPFSRPTEQFQESFFMKLPTDRRWKRTRFVAYHPKNPVEGARTISFELPQFNTASVYLLHDAILQMKIMIVGPDGKTKPAADTVMSTVNNILYSAFSDFKVYFNGEQVYSIGNLFHYRAYMEAELSNGFEAKVEEK